MSGKRKNGEGSYGEKTIKGVKYKYFRDSNGKYTYAKTQKELNLKLKTKKAKEQEEDRIQNNSDGKLTIGDYSKKWLESKKSTIKSKTYDGYEYIIDKIICSNRFMFGGMQIKSIQKEQVQGFFDELADCYARNTIVKTRAMLNQIFLEALDDDLIRKNPVTKAKVPLEDNIVKNTKEITILEQDDIDKLIKEAEAMNGDGLHKPYGKIGTPMYGVAGKMVVFILNTGLRAGEAIDLTWDYVDLDNKKIYIKKAATYIKNRDEKSDSKYKLESGSPKSSKSVRTIPLSDKAIEILEYCKEQRNSDYVFSTKNGTRVLHSNLDKTINRMLKRAGCKVQQCGAHALRHTFASQLLANGVDIQVVSALLGHSKISTTYDKYIHLLDNQDITAIEVLNKKSI